MVMLIGELARRAGVKPQTVRYYESLGLLEERRFIRKAQSLGFSLDDVKQIVEVARAGRAPCSRVLTIAEGHVADLERRIEQLTHRGCHAVGVASISVATPSPVRLLTSC